MPKRDIVVIGASAGGLEALTAIVRQLPASLQACLLIVQHTRANGNGVLPQILERDSELPVSFAENGDPIEPGRIYVARPDCHLLVTTAGLRVARGPRENGFRPAIDPLFRTAAREFGPRVSGCGGALWELEDGRVVRYQCHVGHQYAPDSLEAEQRVTLDGALWTAVRVLEQHAELKLRMARRAQASGLANVSEGFAEGARDAHAQAQQIRGVLIAGGEQGSRAEAANTPARSTPRAKTGPRSQAARARRRPRKRER